MLDGMRRIRKEDLDPELLEFIEDDYGGCQYYVIANVYEFSDTYYITFFLDCCGQYAQANRYYKLNGKWLKEEDGCEGYG